MDDIFDEKLYKLTYNGNVYYIPLWHTELVYDNYGAELYIQCAPILPDEIEIDDENNVHINLEYTIEDIWNKPNLEVMLGKRKFRIMRDQLKIMTEQCIVLENKGIPCINTDEIYDVSKKSDIIVHIKIIH